MYDNLILRLRNCATQAAPCKACDMIEDDSCIDTLMKQAADAIEELQAQIDGWIEHERNALLKSIPKWIPVTERLPECDLGAEVGNIEWISCGMVHAGCFGRGGKYRDAYFRTWTDAGEGMDAKDTDYWRAVTIPEPPKEET